MATRSQRYRLNLHARLPGKWVGALCALAWGMALHVSDPSSVFGGDAGNITNRVAASLSSRSAPLSAGISGTARLTNKRFTGAIRIAPVFYAPAATLICEQNVTQIQQVTLNAPPAFTPRYPGVRILPPPAPGEQTFIAPTGDPERLAELFFKARNYEEASRSLIIVVKAHPRVARYRYLLAESLLAWGQFRAAAAQLRIAVSLSPTLFFEWSSPGKRYAYYEDYLRRLRSLREVAASENASPDAVFLLGCLSYFSGDPARAIDLLGRVDPASKNYKAANHLRLRMQREAANRPGADTEKLPPDTTPL